MKLDWSQGDVDDDAPEVARKSFGRNALVISGIDDKSREVKAMMKISAQTSIYLIRIQWKQYQARSSHASFS